MLQRRMRYIALLWNDVSCNGSPIHIHWPLSLRTRVFACYHSVAAIYVVIRKGNHCRTLW